MSHLTTDARIVLEYLNDLGYRNITAEQLKEFIKDLRKLIKYEELLEVHKKSVEKNCENLHNATTASYRAKLPEKIPCRRNNSNVKQKIQTGVCETSTKPKSPNKKRLNKKPGEPNCNPSEKQVKKMWIRPKSIGRKPAHLQHADPVALYQYYQNEWKRLKINIPGENTHSELRWEIRQKLLGCGGQSVESNRT